MRRFLDSLYALSAFLGGVALVGIAVLIVAQVVARWMGTQIRSSDEFAGYALVATSFLAIAPTYRRAEHIRVGLIIERLTGRPRHVVETAVLAVTIVAVAWASWWIGSFVHDSWQFNELSQGLVPVPLWIPQASMLLGLVVFLVALVEDLAGALRGQSPSYLKTPTAHEGPGFER